MAWSPLSGGDLFAPAQEKLLAILEQIAAAQSVNATAVAVAWLLAHPAQIIPVLGTNTLARIERLSEAFDVTIDRETWFKIYTASLGQEVA